MQRNFRDSKIFLKAKIIYLAIAFTKTITEVYRRRDMMVLYENDINRL